MNHRYRLLTLITIIIWATMSLSGCSSAFGSKGFESSIDPEFEASSFHRVYVFYGEHAGFLKTNINSFFEKAGFTLMDKSEFIQEHDRNDLYVIVTVKKSFSLVPEGDSDSAYIPPASATVEIQDAFKGKQLMSCTYTKGFARDAGAGECGEMLLIELSKVFNDHAKTEISIRDKSASSEAVFQPQAPLSKAKDEGSDGFGIQKSASSPDRNSSNIPAFPITAGSRKK